MYANQYTPAQHHPARRESKLRRSYTDLLSAVGRQPMEEGRIEICNPEVLILRLGPAYADSEPTTFSQYFLFDVSASPNPEPSGYESPLTFANVFYSYSWLAPAEILETCDGLQRNRSTAHTGQQNNQQHTFHIADSRFSVRNFQRSRALQSPMTSSINSRILPFTCLSSRRPFAVAS